MHVPTMSVPAFTGPAGLPVGAQVIAARNDDRGRITAEEVRSLLRPVPPRTALICLENTQNRCGGAAIPFASMREVSGVAREVGVPVHIDGARAFNATVARGYSPAEMAACADTVSICFSKGLGCPMGSILVGSKTDIAAARRARKLFGGALRQAGIVASAAIYALEHHVALGELALDGKLLPVAGVLPAAMGALAQGKGILCPAENGAEAAFAAAGAGGAAGGLVAHGVEAQGRVADVGAGV